jgi:hypothetical protein
MTSLGSHLFHKNTLIKFIYFLSIIFPSWFLGCSMTRLSLCFNLGFHATAFVAEMPSRVLTTSR